MTHNIGESSSAALSTITIGASQESCPRGGDDDEAVALYQGQSQPKMETGSYLSHTGIFGFREQ